MTKSQDEQQTATSPNGLGCAGESSVQPAAILQRFQDGCDKQLERIASLTVRQEFDRGYRSGFSAALADANEILQEVLQVKHEAERDAAG